MSGPLTRPACLLAAARRSGRVTHRRHNTLPEHASADEAARPRLNELAIPMLSPRLHAQVFGGRGAAPADAARVRAAVAHLTEHGLWGRPAEVFDEPAVDIPPLSAASLEEHFRLEAERQAGPYRRLLQALVAQDIAEPPPPAAWRLQPGWTRYDRDGSARAVSAPDCDALVLDVEVVVRRQRVVMATAVSPAAWYGWVSPLLTQQAAPAPGSGGAALHQLLPLEDTAQRPRVIVGHNVSYDRSWVREQYRLRPTGTRFVDTMSMHIAVGGITSQQRAMMMGARRADARPRRVHRDLDWMSQTTMNSLADVYKYYCGETLDKDVRDVFVRGDVADVRAQFNSLMAYCAGDSRATWRVLQRLLPEFLERFPHPVTLAGTLHMGQVYLPVGPAWPRYLRLCSETYTDLENELSAALRRVAAASCRAAHRGRHRRDVWLWDLDWSVHNIKLKKTAAAKKKAATKKDAEHENGGSPKRGGKQRKRKAAAPDEAGVPPLPAGWWEPCQRLTAEQFASDAPLPDLLTERFAPLWRTADRLYKRQPLLPGYPQWYRDLCNKDGSGLTELTTSKRVVPKLLRLTWDGYPLHFDRRFGWGFVVPGRPGHPADGTSADTDADADAEADTDAYTDAEAVDAEDEGGRFPLESLRSLCAARSDRPALDADSVPIAEVRLRGASFHPLPHKDGLGNNVGNPLSKHFLSQVEGGTLAAAAGSSAERVLRVSQTISYWRNNQERIASQLAVFARRDELPDSVTRSPEYEKDCQYGAILPQVKVAGTLTRRAVERTWLTASNVRRDRLGSELRAMVQAPPGYHLVGADVDSQELWIAAVISDSAFTRIHGSTAFSWMTLQGKKSEGTDLHSRTAALVGVSRDLAKVLNYGRIYGGARPFAVQLIRQHSRHLAEAELERRVADTYRSTKGSRRWLLNARGTSALQTLRDTLHDQQEPDPVISDLLWRQPEEPWTASELTRLARLSGTSNNWRDVAGRPVWHGGTESNMFNKLESLASQLQPATPVLGARLSRGLEPELVGDNFMTSRVNWVVQSSAVDFLHLMTVCMQWLMDICRIDGRLCISIHDEVRYLVKSEDRYRAALALHITNLLTRSMFALRLGLDDLPQSVAFFSAVDIDRALRKDVTDDCRTPSNPHGLEAGYNVPPGEVLDIHQTVEKVGTSPLPPAPDTDTSEQRGSYTYTS